MQPQTNWAKAKNPFTGEVPLKEVPVPKIVMPRKGQTKYDEYFDKMMEFKVGYESTEDGFEIIRRSAQRYVKFRNLNDTISIRRQINRKTRMVTIWFEPKEKA